MYAPRTLPLTGVLKTARVRSPVPNEEVPQRKDGTETWEARGLDELRERLRE